MTMLIALLKIIRHGQGFSGVEVYGSNPSSKPCGGGRKLLAVSLNYSAELRQDYHRVVYHAHRMHQCVTGFGFK